MTQVSESDEDPSSQRARPSSSTKRRSILSDDARKDNGGFRHNSRRWPSVPEYSHVEELTKVPRHETGKPTSLVKHDDDDIDELGIHSPSYNVGGVSAKYRQPSKGTSNVTRREILAVEISPPHKPTISLQETFRDKDGNRRGTSLTASHSPDVLQETNMTTAETGAFATPSKKTIDKVQIKSTHPLKAVYCSGIPIDFPNVCVMVDGGKRAIVFSWKDGVLEGGDYVDKPIDKISKVNIGDEKIYLELHHVHKVQSNKIFLHFSSPKSVYDFLGSMQATSPSLNVKDRGDEWIQKAWDKQIYALKDSPALRRENEGSSSTNISNGSEHLSATTLATQPNSRVVDQMLSSTGKTIITGSERAGNMKGLSQRKDRLTGQLPIGYSPKTTSSQTTPGTRLRSQKAAVTVEEDDSDKLYATGYSKTGALGPKWSKPLLYPPNGTKRAEVEFDDLQRLDDDEFLNDNLVGFFLRYLQHYLEEKGQDVSRKIYFFNTFFFQTLTKTIKGKKGINYDGVKKWTRGVDIFSKDFIVVPINESAHWFLAIICNLSGLERKMVGLEDNEDIERPKKINALPSSPEVSEQHLPKSIGGKGDFDEHHGSPMGLDVDEQNEKNREGVEKFSLQTPTNAPPVNPATNPLNRKRGQAKKKFDPQTPAIITIDSLPLMRRDSAVSSLKDYVKAEAESKRNMNVQRTDLQGTAAQEIPKQGNYSDCGLYLLAYMEKFAVDPQRFVAGILQKDMREDEWPDMASCDLRSKLRNLILKLHQAQDAEEAHPDLPTVGNILLAPMKEPDPHDMPTSINTITQKQAGSRKAVASRHPTKRTPDIEVATDAKSGDLNDPDAKGRTNLQLLNGEAQSSTSRKKRNMNENVIHHGRYDIEGPSLLDKVEDAIDRDPLTRPSRTSSVDTQAMAGNDLFEKSLKRKREAEQRSSQLNNTDASNIADDTQSKFSSPGRGKMTLGQEIEHAALSPDELGDTSIAFNVANKEVLQSTGESQSNLRDEIPETQSADENSGLQPTEEVSETQSIDQANEEFTGPDGEKLSRPNVETGLAASKYFDVPHKDPRRAQSEVIEIEDDEEDEKGHVKEDSGNNEDEMLLDHEHRHS